jgi:glucosamine-6-phosphate deaminase
MGPRDEGLPELTAEGCGARRQREGAAVGSSMTLEEIQRLPSSELAKRSRLGIRLFPDIPAMMEFMARSMADEIRANNERKEPTRWILPVGPVQQHFRLVEISNRERISWERVHIFMMDEFLDWQARPLPLDHPFCFEGFMRREVFPKLDPALGFSPDRVVFPSPFRPDEISERMQAVGGVDTCYGGVGYHGHVAFNEPPISRWYRITPEQMRQSLTRVVALGGDSIVVQSIHCAGGSCASVPPMAVTLGLRDILAARRIRLFLAGGERHRAVFRITCLGEPTTDYPSTLLQGHPDCILHTDEATARPILPNLVWG